MGSFHFIAYIAHVIASILEKLDISGKNSKLSSQIISNWRLL